MSTYLFTIAREISSGDIFDQHGIFLDAEDGGYRLTGHADLDGFYADEVKALRAYAVACDATAESFTDNAEDVADAAAENCNSDYEGAAEELRAESLVDSADWAHNYRAEARAARADAEAL
ncbi:MAG: hypothetical protein ACR2JO_07800 [Mycobacteriales bacterium]